MATDVRQAAAGEADDVLLRIPADDVADPELSIVIPALDEELTIGQFVDWCKEGLRRAGVAGEVLIVDSSSANRVAQMRWIDYGLSVLAQRCVERIPAGELADLADLLRDLSVERQLAGFEVAERFYEAGSPVGVRDLERYLSRSAYAAREAK